MIKLAKYLKPFAAGLVLCVLLLFAQAMCDLNLPNYMSDIVNIGIQQNGIEGASPEAVSESGMNLMTSLMEEADQEQVLNAYTLYQPGSNPELEQKYPLLQQEAVYVRNTLSEEELQWVNQKFGVATWTLLNLMDTFAGQQETQDNPTATDLSEGDAANLAALQPMIAALPEETIAQARGKAEAMPESTQVQSGAKLSEVFYEELGMDVGAIQRGYMVKTGAIMVLIALIGGVATVMVSFLASKISAGVARALRRDVFRKVESFSNQEFDKFSTASLITRTTNDITQIQTLLVMGIRMICYAPIMGIGGIMMALEKSVAMSWTIAVAVVVMIGLVMIIFSVAIPKFKKIQKLVDKLNLIARENLNGLMVIRAFGTQEFEKNRFDEVNRELTVTHRFVNRVMVVMMPMMMLIMNGINLLIVWVGAHQIEASAIQVGDMMAFMQYAMQIIMSFLMISMMFIMVPRAAVSGDRIQEVLTTEPEIRDPENPQQFEENKRGVVEFRNVSFRYHGADEDALENISFVAKPGQTTAFIGSTGSGKSTLINLIPRFYDATKGQVLVSGRDVREVPQQKLHEEIGYVPQKGILLSGTIASNLRYGKKDASEQEIEQAAEIAQAMEFINEKPERFESEISQGGTNVSGGQKQRLSIARALAKHPHILIFDDSFSALDFKTDAALRKALFQHTGDSTILIVAQRVSTIMKADQIVVLDEGKVMGIGTHRELLKNCPTYYEIASSQLSKEELE